MDRGRDTKRQGKGHKETGKGTQRDRERDTKRQGKGHKRTRTGIQTRTSTTLTDNLHKNKSVESVKFKHKIRQNRILSTDALYRFKNKRSSMKMTFSKWK
jgi:hypothetical protein